MKRDIAVQIARLKGYSIEAALELASFSKPRLQFSTVEKLWRAYLEWRYT